MTGMPPALSTSAAVYFPAGRVCEQWGLLLNSLEIINVPSMGGDSRERQQVKHCVESITDCRYTCDGIFERSASAMSARPQVIPHGVPGRLPRCHLLRRVYAHPTLQVRFRRPWVKAR